MLRQRLAHLAILLDDLLERLAEIVARARIISLERLSSADIAPGNGFDGLGNRPACVPESIWAHSKQVNRATQRSQQGEKLGCCDRPMWDADNREDRCNHERDEMDPERTKELLLRLQG